MDCLLLDSLGLTSTYSLTQIAQAYRYKKVPLTQKAEALFDSQKFNLIIHPLTRGRHIEWPLKQYVRLINTLPADLFNIITTIHHSDISPVETPFLQPIRDLEHVQISAGA